MIEDEKSVDRTNLQSSRIAPYNQGGDKDAIMDIQKYTKEFFETVKKRQIEMKKMYDENQADIIGK